MAKAKKTQVDVTQLRFFYKLLQKASEEINVELIALNIKDEQISFKMDYLVDEFNKLWNPELYDLRQEATDHYKLYNINKESNPAIAMKHYDAYKELKVRMGNIQEGLNFC